MGLDLRSHLQNTIYYTVRASHYLTVQSFKTGSKFLTEIMLASASALQSAEPPVKKELTREPCYCVHQAGWNS